MPDFSALIPELHFSISSGYVETLIQARREEQFTGLMRLSYSTGENLVFTFLEGAQQKLYHCLDNIVDVVPRQIWFEAVAHANASVGFLRLPFEALRFSRIAYESPVREMEVLTSTPDQLREATAKWAIQDDPCILYVQGVKINRLYLIAGHASPIIEELSFSGDEARLSIGDASFAQTLPQDDYHVVRYMSNQKHEVWREYELRMAFNPLMRMLLHRFSELAGRLLTERLCEQISLQARAEGWNITVTSNGITNRQYFESLASATDVYIALLKRFHEEASSALGSRMVDGISQDIVNKFDPYRRELLIQQVYSQSVDSPAGRAWR